MWCNLWVRDAPEGPAGYACYPRRRRSRQVCACLRYTCVRRPVMGTRLRLLGVALLTFVVAGLLIATGFLGRMVLEPKTAASSASAAPASADTDPAVISEIIKILGEDFV